MGFHLPKLVLSLADWKHPGCQNTCIEDYDIFDFNHFEHVNAAASANKQNFQCVESVQRQCFQWNALVFYYLSRHQYTAAGRFFRFVWRVCWTKWSVWDKAVCQRDTGVQWHFYERVRSVQWKCALITFGIALGYFILYFSRWFKKQANDKSRKAPPPRPAPPRPQTPSLKPVKQVDNQKRPQSALDFTYNRKLDLFTDFDPFSAATNSTGKCPEKTTWNFFNLLQANFFSK